MKVLYSQISHKNLDIASPAPLHVYQQLLNSHFAPQQNGRALDIGCGKAGLIAEILSQQTSLHSIAIDLPNSLAANLTSLAITLIDQGRLKIVYRAAEEYCHDNKDQRYSLILCVGSSQALGGVATSLQTIYNLVEEGGLVLFAEIIWRKAPQHELLEFLGIPESDILHLSQLQKACKEAGFQLIESVETAVEDFDAYENALGQSILSWCNDNPNDPLAGPFQQRLFAWTDARARWARESFGFAVLALRK